MTTLIKRFVAATLLTVSSTSMAAVLDIDFNGNQFLLGAFESAETGTAFYRYNSPSASSANPVYPGTTDLIPLAADALQIFAHTNTNTDQLSFGVILERPNGSGGGSFSTSADWSDPAVLAFVDDTGETGSIGAGGPQVLSLSWLNCCTDGFVITGFDPTDLFLSLAVTGAGLSQVVFLSPNGPGSNTVFDFPSDEFSISITPCNPATDPGGCVIPSPVPEPGTMFLFGLGLAGLGFASRKRS